MIQSIIKTLNSHTNAVGPFREAVGLTVKGDQFIRARIAILLNTGSPVTIGRIVAEFIIATLYRVCFRGPRPHISVKRREGISPPFAYSYSSATVILESRIVRIATPLFHGGPGFVFGRIGHPVRRLPTPTPSLFAPIFRVSLVCSAGVLLVLATTGFRVTVTQMANRNHSASATPANAFPEHATDNLLADSGSSPIAELCSGGYIDSSCHDVLPCEKLWRLGSLAADNSSRAVFAL